MPDDDASKSQVLPPLGEHRPTRADDVPADRGKMTVPLELSPSPPRSEAEAAHAAPAELPSADPDAAPLPPTRRPARRVASLSTACGAHILVLLALVSTPPVEFGHGGTERDAISVSIVPASAIVVRRAIADATAQAAPSQITPELGEDSATSEAAPAKTATSEAKVAQPPEVTESDTKLAAPDEPAPETAPEEAPEVASPTKPPTQDVKVAAAEPTPAPAPAEKPHENTPREEMPTPPSPDARASGGAIALGSAPEESPQPAAAAASHGEINAYGTAVQMALLAVDQREAKARVSATKAKGTVIVRLSIDASGGLVSAEVMRSSGRAELDDAALLLIRLATFPPPPASLTSEQRSYIAPIRFQ